MLSNVHDAGATRTRFEIWLLMAIGLCVAFPSAGCGPSQEDLIMRAARRRRPVEDEETQETSPRRRATENKAVTVAKIDAVEPALSPRSADPTADVATPSDSSDSPTQGKGSSTISEPPGLSPIEQRKPGLPLKEVQRRSRAYANLQQLAEALQQYYREKNRYPQSFATTDSGIPTLSWRVEILPYLGHQSLYEKFDFSKPWNMEPNKSLLQYIPDEFVSPERFDTSTNYLLPAAKSFMFGQQRSPRLNQIEDGADNTIMLLEVNDSLAVPWTQPTDYVPKDNKRLTQDLGGLRGDGTFALWANGWTVLLPGTLRDAQLYGVMTHESGDGPQAGKIHRNITVDVEEETLAASTVSLSVATQTKSRATGRLPVSETSNTPSLAEPRQSVPKAGAIAEAQRKLRLIYSAKIADAKEDDQKAALAREMLANAQRMEGDSTGVYALQTAALRLAIGGGDPSTLIRIIDQRVARFEVDAYEENAKGMLEFGRSAASRDPEEFRSDALLHRTVRVIHAGIQDNDFVRASELAQIAYRFTDQDPKETIPRLIRSLRPMLTTAQREYTSALKHLAAYRKDPSKHDSGAALGRFLCFFKGDWEKGLPLLAKDENGQLRRIAREDIGGAADDRSQAAIGDAWWELSERARGGAYRTAARGRAMHWYRQAYDTMPDSLDRMHVKSRIEDADDVAVSSPLSLCLQLAEELGVDLEMDLVAVSQGGQRRGRRIRDGDDDDD